jgi:hypothetical protein
LSPATQKISRLSSRESGSHIIDDFNDWQSSKQFGRPLKSNSCLFACHAIALAQAGVDSWLNNPLICLEARSCDERRSSYTPCPKMFAPSICLKAQCAPAQLTIHDMSALALREGWSVKADHRSLLTPPKSARPPVNSG